jgi:hypothetical protein
VYRWNGVAWTLVVAVTGVEVLASVGTDLYIGGRFSSAGGVSDADNIARWDGAAVHAIGEGLGGGATAGGFGFRLPGVYALAVLANGTVAVGTNDLPLVDGEVSYGFARIVPCGVIGVEDEVPGASVSTFERLRLASSRAPGRGAAFEIVLPSRADAELGVFDIGGRRVAHWREPRAAGGRRVLALETLAGGARPLPSGVYFARLDVRVGGDVASRTARAVHVH